MTIPCDTGVQVGAGLRFATQFTTAGQTPVEAYVDAAVVSWYRPYAAEVAAIHDRLRSEAQAEFDAATESLVAAHPESRDTVSPAQWRTGLRVVGFIAAAATFAGLFAALGISRRNQPPMDASTAAVFVAITSTLALGFLGSSLLCPSRLGTPNRMVLTSLWIAALSALGAAGALPLRQDTWGVSTRALWALVVIAGIVLFVLASVVTYARRSRAGAAESLTDDDVTDLRVATVAAALDRAVAATGSAWHQLDARTREALEHERDDAIDALQVRTKVELDGAWLRSTTPGMLGLPHAADTIHRGMHLGSAQLVDRREPGRFGYFVKRSRRQRPVGEVLEPND